MEKGFIWELIMVVLSSVERMRGTKMGQCTFKPFRPISKSSTRKDP